jgi:adenine C2-methylase RlmN of 23S rRNA A2503 and tRNA A37
MLGRDVTSTEFLEQALQVLEHYKTQSKADIVNYNFMARGEPFDSLVFTEQCNYILKELAELAYDYDLVPDFNISTILPTETTPKRLWKMFKGIQPNIYYSLYSLNKEFRRKWLPNAMEPKSAFEVLAEWQSFSHKIPRVHFALIKGENDNERDLNELCEFVKSTGVVVDFNIVRYNPFDSDHGEEGNYMLAYDILKPNFRTKIIDRVGFDVMASCGMFHE